MRILAMDTSNQTMSTAVIEDQKILAERTINVKRNHSVQIMPAIEQVLKDAALTLEDMDRIAVAKGPGSYTGVRIAVTVAKTLAWTTSTELVGVSSLKVLAGNASPLDESLIVPIMDARRGNLYTGLYTFREGQLLQLEKDRHVSAEEWVEIVARRQRESLQPVQVIGADYIKYQELFESKLKGSLLTLPMYQQLPRASVVAWLGLKEAPVDVHSFVPEYTKLTEAEENWKEANPDQKGGSYIEKY
ncbi:tRNA (adenosine(37)-N6)-threonylcarbamoyltransferase complex dimerization subunit type 1 TsaB [Marinilactibacillus piezotolerans]|uniref:tRNA (adenosine(37)-N6)-threonylcarbamoyltransferase complex dimerization subunit type 1 TsaB n=1 Tax=Marinilactibacillus piezotolerans TaxID=258723 RepID=UPI0009AFF823|nr:tRNA (adenosine(37)-N6)-threonylcarbamoyltransferase complex dimerization subunit type 1 TsaB [Marinilactibacillus piezotolerans]